MDLFELRFVDGPDSDGDVVGMLVSPVLNPLLFPKGRAQLVLSVLPDEPNGKFRQGKFAINSFHWQSLQQFMDLQQKISNVLESELIQDAKRWKAPVEPDELWNLVQVVSLDLRPRNRMATPLYEALRKRMSEEKANKLAGNEGEETQSFFTISVQARWDEEHLLRCQFRNGTLTKTLHE
ncbi:MAG TPA: hypothetical protein VGN72_01055 [Tepidisphaeraceae bacterium]|nr:hypothetical protein [Tepidisphaeraceae bacterium]